MNDFATMAASLRGSEPRVLSGNATLSASALSAFEKSLAEALDAHGLRRIASRLDNGPAWLALDLAIRRLGGVHIPLPTFFSAGQVTHALRSSGAEAVVQRIIAANLGHEPATTKAPAASSLPVSPISSQAHPG